MSSLAQAHESPIQNESVTTISATARVDYILRFSKQAVMVIDDQVSLCSSIGSQFLSNLSSEHNASYITMSAKLDDLQVRCRVIEQLFGNTLFDPEQSLAVSVINLVKKHQQAVCIVVDNAHLLSLQLMHELCQLAEIANKSDYQISVLMLAATEGGSKISQNLSLFHKKLSIISAQTGQLISHSSKLFSTPTSYLSFTPMKKWLVIFTLLALMGGVAIYLLLQRDVLSFSQTLAAESTVALSAAQAPIFVSDTSQVNKKELADTSDIYLSLMGNIKSDPQLDLVLKAEPVDIISAIESSDIVDTRRTTDRFKRFKREIEPTKPVTTFLAEPKKLHANIILKASENSLIKEAKEIKEVKPAILFGEDYYLNQQRGFVIQLAGFTQQSVMNEFLVTYNDLSVKQYQRIINDELMTFLTTESFATRADAESALEELAPSLIERSPWIKSISAINNEIINYQRSQSIENNVTIPSS